VLYTVSRACSAWLYALVLWTPAVFKFVCSRLVNSEGTLLADIFIENEEEGKLAIAMLAIFKQYSPTFEGPSKPEDSVRSVLALIDKAIIDGGYAGIFISHTESKPYL
jgi:hypothetical protein